MRLHLFTLVATAQLAACSAVPTMTPEQLQAMAADKSTVVLCTHVSTLITTVRTVYLQSDKGAAATVAAGAECAVALTK